MPHDRVSRISGQRSRDERILGVVAAAVFTVIVAFAAGHVLLRRTDAAPPIMMTVREQPPDEGAPLPPRAPPAATEMKRPTSASVVEAPLPSAPLKPTGSSAQAGAPASQPSSKWSVTIVPTAVEQPTRVGIPQAPEPRGAEPAPSQSIAAPPLGSPRADPLVSVAPAPPAPNLAPRELPGSPVQAEPSAVLADRIDVTAVSSGIAGSAAVRGPRVFVHYSRFRDVDRDRAIRLARALRAQGFQVADIRPVDANIRAGSVRFFFPEDRGNSEAVLRSFRQFYDEEGGLGEPPRQPQGLTGYNPKPSFGTVEIWIPSR